MMTYSEADLWTDPAAMLARMIDSNRAHDLLESRRMARRLAGWILHGGPGVPGLPDRLVLERCRETEQWAECMLAGPGGDCET